MNILKQYLIAFYSCLVQMRALFAGRSFLNSIYIAIRDISAIWQLRQISKLRQAWARFLFSKEVLRPELNRLINSKSNDE